MTWLRKDDAFAAHRKIRRLSDGAYRLHDEGMLACAKDESDGVLHREDIPDLPDGVRLSEFIPEVVKAGLWHRHGHRCDGCPPAPRGGFVIHDFLDFNPSHADLEADREAARARQAAHRARRRNAVTNDVTDAVTNGGVTRESHHESRPPVPSRPSRPSRPVVDGSPQASNVTDLRARSARLTIDGGSDGIA